METPVELAPVLVSVSYEQIQKEIMKGSLQERLGYDLYMNVMNHSWDRLPAKYKEKFEYFLEKEGEVVTINKSLKPVTDEANSSH